MKIVRADRHYRFEVVSRDLVVDTRLSYRARAIATRLLANADGYAMSAIDLARESPTEGRHAVLSALRELRGVGYVQVERKQNERGHWSTVTTIYDQPRPESNEWTSETEVRLPDAGLPESGEPASGNRTLKSTNTSTNTKTTTTEALDWSFLPQLSTQQRVVVAANLRSVEALQQQDLLDELAGAIRAKAIKGQWPAWLHALACRAQQGGFQPSHALAIQAERRRRSIEAADVSRRKMEATERNSRMNDPVASARNRELAAVAFAEARTFGRKSA